MNSGINPIKQLGSVLANFKSTSLLFELASFRGGSAADQTPASASMTVVINSADEEKFIQKMDNALERFYDKYADQYPDASYTYEEVDLPKRVLVSEDAENIVSLLYTAFNGTYYKDDDGNVIALTNIGSISTKNQRLTGISGRDDRSLPHHLRVMQYQICRQDLAAVLQRRCGCRNPAGSV